MPAFPKKLRIRLFLPIDFRSELIKSFEPFAILFGIYFVSKLLVYPNIDDDE